MIYLDNAATSWPKPPAVAKRMPVLRDNKGSWLRDRKSRCPGRKIEPNAEMQRLKRKWVQQNVR